MHSQRTTAIILFILLATVPACDNSVKPGGDPATIVELPGCKSPGLEKNAVLDDSCFSYDFHNVLTADFCIVANCCPDSNRFSIEHSFSKDTITVTVADTAARLCRCDCTHWLHAEFSDLEGDQFQFLVYLEDSSNAALLYSVRLQRI